MANLRKEAKGRECQVADIHGYEGRYQITSDGRVFSLISNKFLSHGIKPGGYAFVGLHKKGVKTSYRMVHRLVAEAFIPNPYGKPEVNHINGDKLDNSINNLEWVTSSENTRHGFANGLLSQGVNHHFNKLNPDQIKEVYYAKGKYRDIGKEYGISAQTVCNIKRKSVYKSFLEGIDVQE